MKKTAPRISDQAAELIGEQFRSLNSGCEYILDAWPGLYRRTLHDLKGRFTAGELSLMVDVFNATALTAGIAGQHLKLNCSAGIDLDHLDEKWSIKKAPFIKKLQELTIFEATCLEIWANGFWYGGDPEKPLELEKHIAMLA